MDRSVDKELGGKPHVKSCSQRLIVHVESRDERCPSRVVLGLIVFTNFVGDIVNGIETPSASVTELSGVVNTVERRGGD